MTDDDDDAGDDALMLLSLQLACDARRFHFLTQLPTHKSRVQSLAAINIWPHSSRLESRDDNMAAAVT